MGNVHISALKSTIGRTHKRAARRLELEPRKRVARHQPSFRLLITVGSWVCDLLAIAPDLDGWSPTEEEIRADLEYGRD
jgi:hypothetical protein